MPLDDKTVAGLEEYARSWPGRILVVATVLPGPQLPREEHREYFDVIATRNAAVTIRNLKPAAVLALHRGDSSAILNTGVPVVLTSEYPMSVRLAQQLIRAQTSADRVRIMAGSARQELHFRTSARNAAGLQCNGFPSWKAYASLNRSPIFFHDHRIRTKDIPAALATEPWDGSRPLRIAFSGRLTAIKGPQFALQMARELDRKKAPVELYFTGDGDLRQELEKSAPENTHFIGMLDFEREWKPFFRNHVDIAILPHPQGDPSCTYFEALGCGAPILGFANSTLTPLIERSDAGWTTRSNGQALANKVFSLLENPEQIAAARSSGINYIAGQTFENVAHQRMRHVLECIAT
ncbi:glycosyltransferase [Sinomonas cyclohexanicum]|uniref:glycosyltransferase n=1 Tax=Sinomonas cyclohexanicum TaxID=322009 RepID=UPI001E3A37E0|nr:glycosyltransferase [Corynebacterium cyclohexanicum]